MENARISASCAALLGLMVLSAHAGDFAPGGNAGTLARGSTLPALGDSRVKAAGKFDWRATLDFTNEYVSEGNCAAECILLDGETARLQLAGRYGLGHGWEISAAVPVLSRSGGFMDGWIETWHGWFGLPNAGREYTPKNQYHYRYERGGATVLDATETGNCLGDAQVGAAYALGWEASLRGMAKLPTGDEDALCGGNAGGALWFDASLPVPKPWAAYVAAGYSMNAKSEILEQQRKSGVPFAGAGVLVPLTEAVRIHAQLQLHGKLYGDSAMTPLSRIGAPLTLGLNIRASKSIQLDLGFQEDPSVNASPDFVAYLSVASR